VAKRIDPPTTAQCGWPPTTTNHTALVGVVKLLLLLLLLLLLPSCMPACFALAVMPRLGIW